MSTPLGASRWRLAEAEVLIAVRPTERGPEPLVTLVGEEVAAVAYTDQAEAEADTPETHRLYSITVADFLRQLPADAGLVVDPRSGSPVHVAAEDKREVIDAARPFPSGVSVQIGDPAVEPAELLDALRRSAPTRPPLRRLWRTWYQKADTAARLLVVYEVDASTGADEAAADLVIAAAQAVDHAGPLLVLALDDLPTEHRGWLLAETPPFYERP